MNDISNVSNQLPAGMVRTRQVESAGESESGSDDKKSPQAIDRAEFSELGKLLSLARELPDVRAEKVAQIRAALQENEEGFIRERLDSTIERLIEDLFS